MAVVLARAAEASGTAQSIRVGLGLASIVLSWGLVHTVFTLLGVRHVTDREIRTTALKHALLSFLFSTVIIATTINLAASLSTK